MASLVSEWGGKLAELRKSSGLSAAAVVKRLADFGIVLDRGSIYAYEAGRVAAPDAIVVWGLARVYRVKLEDLLNVLVDARAATRLVQSIRSREPEPSRAELDLLRRLRRLSPSARKACLDFIDFQLQRSHTGTDRRR
jgi:transcriptional regulator with XRE-family HTH domain